MTRGRVFVLVALWAIVTGAIVSASGCYGHNCEGSTAEFGRNPNEGRLLDPNMWESNGLAEEWLPFPHQRVWTLHTTGLGTRNASIVNVYISAQENPLRQYGNYTQAAGNIVQIYAAQNGVVVVQNGTCADYFMRTVVIAAEDPDAGVGTDPDASDAGTDDASDAAGD